MKNVTNTRYGDAWGMELIIIVSMNRNRKSYKSSTLLCVQELFSNKKPPREHKILRKIIKEVIII